MNKIIAFLIFNLGFSMQVKASNVKPIYFDFKVIEVILHNYFESCHRYPTTKEGLTELYKPSNKCWSDQKFDKHLFIDRSNQKEYIYIYTGKTDKSFKLISAGIDGIINTEDDMTNNDSELKQIKLNKQFYKYIKSKESILSLSSILIIYGLIMVSYLIFKFRRKIFHKFKRVR
jgi:hypothetical protein